MKTIIKLSKRLLLKICNLLNKNFEVKSGNTYKMSGINAFQKEFKPNKVYLIGTTGIPWQEFLKLNPNELF